MDNAERALESVVQPSVSPSHSQWDFVGCALNFIVSNSSRIRKEREKSEFTFNELTNQCSIVCIRSKNKLVPPKKSSTAEASGTFIARYRKFRVSHSKVIKIFFQMGKKKKD